MANPLHREYAKYIPNANLDRLVSELERAPLMLRRKHMVRQWRYPRFIYKFRALTLPARCAAEHCSVNPSSIEESSIDRLRDYVVRSEFRLSSPADFNDPFDVSARLTAQGSVVQRREKFLAFLRKTRPDLSWKEREREVGRWMQRPDAETEDSYRIAFESNRDSMGIGSFAGTCRDILLWSHYAKDHSGVCLQFSTAKGHGTFLYALPVSYSGEYPTLDFFGDDYERTIPKVLLQKYVGWRYEAERRIVIPDGAHKYIRFPPAALTGIIVGCKAGPMIMDVVRRLAKERSDAGLPPLILYRASRSSSQYKLTLMREPS